VVRVISQSSQGSQNKSEAIQFYFSVRPEIHREVRRSRPNCDFRKVRTESVGFKFSQVGCILDPSAVQSTNFALHTRKGRTGLCTLSQKNIIKDQREALPFSGYYQS
jgi:hypothetical protein